MHMTFDTSISHGSDTGILITGQNPIPTKPAGDTTAWTYRVGISRIQPVFYTIQQCKFRSKHKKSLQVSKNMDQECVLHCLVQIEF